jgi:hypothetical protein
MLQRQGVGTSRTQVGATSRCAASQKFRFLAGAINWESNSRSTSAFPPLVRASFPPPANPNSSAQIRNRDDRIFSRRSRRPTTRSRCGARGMGPSFEAMAEGRSDLHQSSGGIRFGLGGRVRGGASGCCTRFFE